jgi:hypothetical protein
VQDIERCFELSLNPTLLFEYDTLRKLESYLESEIGKNGIPHYSEVKEEQKNKNSKENIILQKKTPHPLDIAIIGLSGRYPQSYNVKEFLENLFEGKDCITEIPKDRWDWREKAVVFTVSGEVLLMMLISLTHCFSIFRHVKQK